MFGTLLPRASPELPSARRYAPIALMPARMHTSTYGTSYNEAA